MTAGGRQLCRAVYYTGDESVVVIEQASEAIVKTGSEAGPNAPVFETSMKPLFGNTKTVMDVDGNVKAEVQSHPDELPVTREVTIVGDDGVARQV